ncbi:unnamed protein product [Trichogramma brassicae]|uniref:Uncharacterized protein n=1 Tax=Trichogramma brassicae TaxID=86971 RepID=A0A6H5J225_9HYME|nr:unnamed protein product [Trichogramma brassicae]
MLLFLFGSALAVSADADDNNFEYAHSLAQDFKSRDEPAICPKLCKIRPVCYTSNTSITTAQFHGYAHIQLQRLVFRLRRTLVRPAKVATLQYYICICSFTLSRHDRANVFRDYFYNLPVQKTHTLGANVTECLRDAGATPGVNSTQTCSWNPMVPLDYCFSYDRLFLDDTYLEIPLSHRTHTFIR